MKASRFVAPAAALAVAAAWLGTQHHAIRELRDESAVLRRQIDAFRPVAGSAAAAAASRRDKPAATGRSGLDWKALAAKLEQARRQGDLQSLSSHLRAQQQIQAMSVEQLSAAIDEIDALDLPREIRDTLLGAVFGALGKNDPRLLLDRYFERLSTEGPGHLLTGAFDNWLKQDPAAAGEWFDQQLATDQFASKSLDGKNPLRLSFEAALFSSLIGSDPQAAGQRIASLPADQRRTVLEQAYWRLPPGSQKDFVQTVREQVPAKDQAEMLKSGTTMMVLVGGYERVDEFFKEIDAPPAERVAITSHAAAEQIKRLDRENQLDAAAVGTLREWAAKNAPEQADAITGAALGGINGPREKFDTALKLLNTIPAQDRTDALWSSFLAGPLARSHPESALPLAANITDPALRAKALERLGGQPNR